MIIFLPEQGLRMEHLANFNLFVCECIGLFLPPDLFRCQKKAIQAREEDNNQKAVKERNEPGKSNSQGTPLDDFNDISGTHFNHKSK